MMNTNHKFALIALSLAIASPMALAQSADAQSAAPPQAIDSVTGVAQEASVEPAAQPAAAPGQAATMTAAPEAAASAQPQRKSWASIDVDADGKISATEAQTDPALLKQFPAIDADKDGFVTVAEYKAHLAARSSKKDDSKG